MNNLIIYSSFILDWELKLSAKELDIHHKHQQLSLLNDKLEQSEEKINLITGIKCDKTKPNDRKLEER